MAPVMLFDKIITLSVSIFDLYSIVFEIIQKVPKINGFDIFDEF